MSSIRSDSARYDDGEEVRCRTCSKTFEGKTSDHQRTVSARDAVRIGWLAFALFAASLALRMVYLNDGLFHFDSVMMVENVEKTAATGQFHSWFRSGAEIVNLILYLPLHAIIGLEKADYTARLTNAIFGSLSVSVLFLMTYLLLDRIFAGLSAAILFSVSPLFLSVTTIAKVHGVETFFVLTAIYLVFRFHRTRSRVALAFSAASMGFAPWVRESALLFVPIYVLAYLRPELYVARRFLRVPACALLPANLACILVPLLLVLGLGLYVDIFDRFYQQVLNPVDFNSAQFIGFFSPILPIALRDAATNFGLPIAVLGASGIGLLLVEDRDKFLPVFLVAWLSTVFYFGNVPSYGARYLTVASIPVYVFVGVSLSALSSLSNRLARPGASVVLALVSALSFSSVYPLLEYRSRVSGPKDYALWLKEQVPPDALIIVMDDSVFVRYYAGLRTKSPPIGDAEAMQGWTREVGEILKSGTPVYLIGTARAYHPQFRKTLSSHFALQKIASRRTEDYHRAELRFTLYESLLIRILPRRP